MTGEPAKTKPTTRSSLRQSLNLASVGKALGFAESSTTSAAKNTKKNKDPAASRRHSALVLPAPPAPRPSMGDSRPPSLRTATPEAKPATTRKRGSMSLNRPGSSADESSAPSKADSAVSPQPISSSARVATLRPRNLNASAPAVSALPKYRPKSTALEVAKPPSPVLVRAGTRRRLSTSDDEKRAEQQNKPIGAAPSVSVEKKHERPISPLPQRAALTANLTNGLTPSPHSSPSRPKAPASGNGKAASGSPSRPNKIVKTSAAATTTTAPSRPGSASTPKGSTPKTSGLKAKLGLSGKTGASTATPSNGHRSYSPLSRDTPSPLAHRSRPPSTKLMTSSSASASGASSSSASMAASSGAGNMSHISEANSADEEEDDDADIELLLAPVAALSAPTPAMPRIQPGRKRLAPQTPTRPPGGLPSRAEMSYLSPAPPDESSPAPNRSSKNGSSSQQRPVPIARLQLPSGRAPPTAAQEKAMRGSIMSWEQLANEASVSLGEDEFGRMLSDIPAPFRSGAASPSLSSQMSTGLPGGPGGGGGSMPASPLLLSTSSLDASPGAYGSISQVLLPDVTPSPAAYMHASARYNNLLAPLDGSKSGSGGKTTMLRLQLAAAERQAAEREAQIRALEEELHELARAGARQAEESAAQIAYMEQQWRAERAAAAAQTQNTQMDEDDEEEEEERDDTLTLPEVERMLNDAKHAHEREVQRVWEEAEAARMQEVQRESLRGVLCASAAAAEARWGAVHTACSAEIDVVKDERAVLKLLLVQLDALAKSVFV